MVIAAVCDERSSRRLGEVRFVAPPSAGEQQVRAAAARAAYEQAFAAAGECAWYGQPWRIGLVLLVSAAG